jgi:peptide/nickel transport system ATP-binding protein
MSALLTVDNLSVSYRRGSAAIRAVDGVDLAVPAGVMLGLVGESGCGKSTLARALMGVLPGNARIEGGSIYLAGEDLLAIAPQKRRERLWRDISFVPQTAMNALDPVYRLRDQMREVLIERGGMARAAADRRAEELFGAVGLNPQRLADFPHQFSGGMRQRAAMSRSPRWMSSCSGRCSIRCALWDATSASRRSSSRMTSASLPTSAASRR